MSPAISPRTKTSKSKSAESASSTSSIVAASASAAPSVQPLKRRGWKFRITQLQTFYDVYGHSHVTIQHEAAFPGLYQWTRTIRSQHGKQQQVEISNHDVLVHDDNVDDINDNSKAVAVSSTTTTSNNATTTIALSKSSRPKTLSTERLDALNALNFAWQPLPQAAWKHQYCQLQRFYNVHGHCRVPANNVTIHMHYPGLAVWVRNQRRDCETLTNARMAALQRLNFTWYQSHDAVWTRRYEQLQQFQQVHGHCHVPQEYVIDSSSSSESSEVSPLNGKSSLGHWCMNQRTAYKRHRDGLPTALTNERIQLLQELGFVWNVKDYFWHCKLERLRKYYCNSRIASSTTATATMDDASSTELPNDMSVSAAATAKPKDDGHVSIPVADLENRDLRLWLAWLRYCYHNNQRTVSVTATTNGSSSTTLARYLPRLSQARIQAVEAAIPAFVWSPRDARKNDDGPSTEDWAKLFDAMRDKGIAPGVRPKQHWFEGMNPQAVQVKDVWTEQELLELWNQDQDENDDDDDGYVDLRDRRDRGYN